MLVRMWPDAALLGFGGPGLARVGTVNRDLQEERGQTDVACHDSQKAHCSVDSQVACSTWQT